MYESFNPYTGKRLAVFAQDDESASSAILQRLVHKRRRECDFFSYDGVQSRAQCLQKMAQLLSEQREDLAQTIRQEMGKPIAQAIAEVDKSAQLCLYYAEPAQWEVLAMQHIQSEQPSPLRGLIIHQPLGIVLQIMPWNFPIWQVLRFAVPAFLAGNSILLKHAPNTTRCAIAIENLWAQSVGADVLLHIRPSYELLARMIAAPEIAGIAFTGSNATGSTVGALAGKHTKKTLLELGGSDAFVLLEDAENIEKIAEQAAWARLQNNGQTCIAAKRFIIHHSIYEPFESALIAAIERLKIGDPMKMDTQLSTLARTDLAQTLKNQVQTSIQQGATLIEPSIKARSIGKKPCFFAPLLLTNLSPQNIAASEEFFGGVFALFRAQTEAEMLQIANHTPFGLGASVWTADAQRAINWAQRLEVGAVAINQILRSDARLPFGGVKQSGYGRELGKAGLLEFVNIKSVIE